MRQNRTRNLYWLLISLMLAVQSLSHAHEITHIGETESGLCAVCSASGGLAAALPAPDQCLVIIPGAQVKLAVTAAHNNSPQQHARQPRAPPLTP